MYILLSEICRYHPNAKDLMFYMLLPEIRWMKGDEYQVGRSLLKQHLSYSDLQKASAV